MTNSATTGLGTTAQLDNASGSLTSLGEIVSVSPFKASRGTADATHLGSTWGEVIPLIAKGGALSVTVHFIPGDATDVLVRTAVGDGLQRTFKTTFLSTKYVQTECFVTDYEPATVTPEGKMEMTFIVQPTGAPTYG